ncbi:MAG: glycosyltransferase [Gemmatimonadales bacterium]
MSAIFADSRLRPFVVLGFKLFRWRARSLVAGGRARAFVMGQQLIEQYGSNSTQGDRVIPIWPILSSDFVTHPRSTTTPARRNESAKVLYVGRLSEEKNVASLIEAVGLLAQEGKNVALTVVGFGECRRSLEELARRTGVDSIVHFKGYVPHGPPLIEEFDNHDIFCLPSFTEGTPRVILEALARGLSVCATPIPGLVDEFADHVAFAKGFSPEDLARILLKSMAFEQRGRGEVLDRFLSRFLVKNNAEVVARIVVELSNR